MFEERADFVGFDRREGVVGASQPVRHLVEELPTPRCEDEIDASLRKAG